MLNLLWKENSCSGEKIIIIIKGSNTEKSSRIWLLPVYTWTTSLCGNSGSSAGVVPSESRFWFHRLCRKLNRLFGFEIVLSETLSEVGFMFCTCWRQTCTASCTLTKNHSVPIRSATPARNSRRWTPWFGLAMAIWNGNLKYWMNVCGYTKDVLTPNYDIILVTWMPLDSYSWCKPFRAWIALESIYATAAKV